MCGLVNNYSQLEVIADEQKPDFIVLTETHLTDDIEEQEIQLRNYDQYVTRSNSNRTGGVIIYWKKQWNVIKIGEKSSDYNYWISAYKATMKNNQFVIVAVYRSPSSSEVEFCQVFEQVMEEICEAQYDIIIAGDFNIDWCKEETYKKRLECAFNDNGLKQIVNDYTRITENTKTIIDYVITNSENVSAANNSLNKIADHEAIDIKVKTRTKNQDEISKKEIEIFKYNKTLFNQEISAILKNNENDDLNITVDNFDSAIENTIKKFTNKKTINTKSNVNKWFNRELKLLKKEKVRKYQIAKTENTDTAWNNYKITRNTYKTQIEAKKNNYINKQINNAKDQKQMWREIKNLVLKKNKTGIKDVIFNDIEYKDNYQMATQFNDYFVNSIKSINNTIENVQYINNIPVITTRFRFRAVTIQDLQNICKNMKNKPDFNNVTIKLIMDNWNIIGKSMREIINKSLETGVFPDSWKYSMVTPIEKIAKTNKCEEFRPINTLKTCEKIMEKIVKEQLETYMEQHNLFSKYQSGFRKKFSCETTVNYVINRWKYADRKKKIMAIFLDFKRAFETIDRELLIRKLYMYGIRESELKWFKSYLTNRKQITKVNGVKSNKVNNEFGVPQGSILGALLFIIYINDMPNILEKCEIILYADDTLIYAEGDTDEQCRENLMHDINKINSWLKMNRLKLNENKTKLLEVNMDSESIIKINNEEIEKVNKIKYLGFIIDKDLKLKEHIDYICKKIGKKIGFFKRVRNKISQITAIHMYNTMIKPHFEFGSTILYTCCSTTQIERLQKLQNKAMRSILKCNIYTPIRLMLDTLKWLNIHQRLELNTLQFIHKMKIGNAPEYLTEQLGYVREVQPYHLRNAENFRLPRAKTTAMQQSLFFKGLKLYNLLPNNIKTERNINISRRNITQFVKNNMVNSIL